MSTDLATMSNSSISHLPEELQKKILEASQKIQNSSAIVINKIRLDAKSFIFPDQNEVQSFQGIVVGVKHANLHYKGDYEDGVMNPVDCIAVGDVSCQNLSPHEKVEAPYCANCNECSMFQWGSATRGKGKSCGEHTLLAVYVPSYGEDLLLFEAKKANSRAADGYLNTVSSKFGHPIAVNTQFTMGEKNKWEQSFVAVSPTDASLVTNLVGRFEEADAMLTARVVDAYRPGEVAAAANTQTDASPRAARAR